MFVDNSKKIICLSIPGINPISAELFFREQLQNNVKWMLSKNFLISSLVSENYLTSPILEYDIYGLCRNPIDRIVDDYLFYYTLPGTTDSIINAATGGMVPKQFYELSGAEGVLENIKIILERDFLIESISMSDLRKRALFTNQVSWLKNDGVLINHVFKYENSDAMISELCGRYSIDSNLYIKEETSPFFKEIKNNLGNDLTSKILEHYAEDKALYDSL